MIKKLIMLANHFDKKGLQKEANYLDNIIKKLDKKAEKLSSMVEKEIQMISDQ